MMAQKEIAVIDLGTNTFHLVIASLQQDGTFDILVRKRIFVKLANEGINTLGKASMDRGMQALGIFVNLLEERGISSKEVVAVGTAALRTANNGSAFLNRIRSKFGLEIDIIDGLKEAALIYKGVRQIWNPADFPVLIMDIGGGSVEFIIANQEKVLWSRSYPIGVSILYRTFHHADPISPQESEKLHKFLCNELRNLSMALETFHPRTMIGASGTFDVLADLLDVSPGQLYAEVASSSVIPVLEPLTKMTVAERSAHPQIPETRVDMIVVAVCLLINVIRLGDFHTIGISRYALKEGAIAEQWEQVS
ncbi:MAG: hypothetical protein HKN87_05015 [Saprospiraceae bacterium]|nr:hypothetical protein [Saprospiraceae bacterium]